MKPSSVFAFDDSLERPMVKPTIERISPARPVEGRDLIAPINDKMAAANPA